MYHVVFHRADLDGIGSCMVVLKHLLKEGVKADYIKLHAWNYGEEAPNVDNGDDIFIVDCSFKPEEMLAIHLGERNGLIHVTWIDHHKTAYDDSVRHDYDKMGGLRSLARPAAIELCWMHFFGSKNIPKGIQLLSQYDTWCNEDAFAWGNDILPFQYGMRLKPWLNDLIKSQHDNNALNQIVSRFHNICLCEYDDVSEEGSIIIRYQETQDEITSKRAFSFRFHGVTFAVINTLGNSNTFRGIPFMYDACMTFYFDGKKNKWKFSMYGVNDKGEKPIFDLSIIAKEMGGGGHAAACGFEVDDLDEVFGNKPIGSDPS